MSLTIIEQTILWGTPIISILLSVGYYLRWGKESESDHDTVRSTSVGSEN